MTIKAIIVDDEKLAIQGLQLPLAGPTNTINR